MKTKEQLCIALIALTAASCVSTPPPKPQNPTDLGLESPLPPPSSGAPALKKLWSKRLKGYVSDLSCSGSGNAVLVATVPNYERDDGDRTSYVRYFTRSGREAWRKEVPTRVKSQAISRFGKFVVVATHDDEIDAFDAKGKSLWRIPAACKPILLNGPKKIICYHEDDAEPDVAFDVYNWKGKWLSSFPIHDDILALKVSPDERSFAIALTGGAIIGFGPDFKPSWQARVPGEIVDIDVSQGKTAALYTQAYPAPMPGVRQRLAIIDSTGHPIADIAPRGQLDEVLISQDGTSVFGYGNGENGQYISRFFPLDWTMAETWRKGTKWNARYTLLMYRSASGAIIGFEQVSNASPKSYVLSVNGSGATDWAFPVSQDLGSDEGSYLYAQSWSPAGAAAIATDDGSFGLYQKTGQ